ncbi:MAG: hypothetical protein HOP29_01430, partial [Phycisphaerales bacterium]|nr:hypothetical protein [Phycisphaerales bacterium]
PYGHHLESLLPLPWVHLWFAPKTLFAACAEIYDDPTFVPRIWDRDPVTGGRRPNKWRATESFEPFLNKLTRRDFESAVSRAGFAIAERRAHGFAGSTPARATRPLTRVPVVGECFVSFYTYRLVRERDG